jgi:hypothetical protein
LLLIKKGEQNEKFSFHTFDCVSFWWHYSFNSKKEISEDENHRIDRNIHPLLYISGSFYRAGAKPSEKAY